MNKDNLDNIKVPSNISEYINEGIEKADREMKVKRKKLRIRIGYTAAALTIIILTLGITNPVLAEDIPILKDIFKVLQHEKNTGIPEGDFSRNAKDINLVQESNGVTITAQQMVYDGESVYVSYKIEAKEGFPYKTRAYAKKYITNEDDIVIGGEEWVEEEIDWMFFDSTENLEFTTRNHLTDGSPTVKGKIVDDNTFIGIARYIIPDVTITNGTQERIDIPDEFNINIDINKISLPIKKEIFNATEEEYKDSKYIVEGEWKFSIPIKEDPKMKNVIQINEVKDGFELESITKTPFSTIIKIVPLNIDNQKNNISGGNKVMQLQVANLMDVNKNYSNKSVGIYGQGMPSSIKVNKENEIPGTIYMYIENSILNESEYFNIVVEDYIRIGQPCTKECENEEHHINSPHPKQIIFDTKIK